MTVDVPWIIKLRLQYASITWLEKQTCFIRFFKKPNHHLETKHQKHQGWSKYAIFAFESLVVFFTLRDPTFRHPVATAAVSGPRNARAELSPLISHVSSWDLLHWHPHPWCLGRTIGLPSLRSVASSWSSRFGVLKMDALNGVPIVCLLQHFLRVQTAPYFWKMLVSSVEVANRIEHDSVVQHGSTKIMFFSMHLHLFWQ